MVKCGSLRLSCSLSSTIVLHLAKVTKDIANIYINMYREGEETNQDSFLHNPVMIFLQCSAISSIHNNRHILLLVLGKLLQICCDKLQAPTNKSVHQPFIGARAGTCPRNLFSCYHNHIYPADRVAEGLAHSSPVLKVCVQNTTWSEFFQKLSLFIKQWVPGFSSELEKVKAVRKRSDAHLSYTVARTNWHFLATIYLYTSDLALGLWAVRQYHK